MLDNTTGDKDEKIPLITFAEARALIENVSKIEIKMYLKAVYLLGAAPDELTGRLSAHSSQKRTNEGIIYGPKGCDVSHTSFEISQPKFNLNDIINFSNQIGNSKLKADEFVNDLSKTPIALFKIKNIKQGNKIFEKASGRIVALPLSEKYEPWTKSLFDYFKTRENSYVFPSNRVRYYHYVSKHDVFKGKKYRTQPYKNGGKGNLRDVKLYSLRYLRTSELMIKYHFNWIDWEIYTGMKMRYQTRLENQIKDPRDYGDWKTYIAKLCRIDS